MAFARLASWHGWALSEVFAEDEPARPLLGFGALLAAGRACHPVAVLVPSLAGLGSVPAALRRRIEHELGAAMVAAPADPVARGPVPSRSDERGV